MTPFILLLLTFTPLIFAEEECPGKFNRQPCLTSNGTAGACIGLYPPCAKGFECKPYYMCDPTQKPLTDQCLQAGEQCVVGDAKESILGSCVSSCPSDNPSCSKALSCVTPSRTAPEPSSAEGSESATPTTVPTDDTVTGPTLWFKVQPDQARVQACQSKSTGDACTINNKPGKCSFQRPPEPQPERRRVPLLLQCFETPSQVSNAVCKDKTAGDSCGERLKCVASSAGALTCAVVDDEPPPSASSIVSVTVTSTIVLIGLLMIANTPLSL